ncbi:diacylglycerol/lipid kinase family protein [Chitinimonas lacunae]|uniref:Diacylglycerol/lipid kinase family protein n=1 Tax=Chitinimonas lacunae TaxID=1963018 RepID=A0ABV8MSA3_9NEIS
MTAPLFPCEQPSNSGPLFVVLNGASGRAATEERQRLVSEQFNAAGRGHEYLTVKSGRELPQVARRAVELAQRERGVVVAAGGDGTINAVAQEVLDYGLPFGVLPQGTFNYFGRANGISQDIATAARALVQAPVRPVQVGQVNGHRFLVNASIGLYPKLLEDREQWKRQYGRSRLVALGSAIATVLREHRRLNIELVRGEQIRIIHATTLFVGNNALQLKQLGLPEAERIEQGELAALALHPVSRLTMLWLMLRSAFGKLADAEEVQRSAFRHMTVEPRLHYGSHRIKVAVDGEILWLRPPLHFEVAPHPLYLVAAEPTGPLE